MDALNLPTYSFNIKSQSKRKYIFDTIRKKYFLLTPEEWVRQNFIQYLVADKKYPASLISIEKHLKINNLSKRTDIVLYNNIGNPIVIVECKSPKVNIDQNVFDQIARYNLELKVNFLIVTNGLKHYCCKMDHDNSCYSFLKDIPSYDELINC